MNLRNDDYVHVKFSSIDISFLLTSYVLPFIFESNTNYMYAEKDKTVGWNQIHELIETRLDLDSSEEDRQGYN